MSYRKNQGKPKWALLSYKALLPLVRVMEYGLKKYPGEPWRDKALPKNEILESTMRHLTAMLDGEEIDKESGENHSGHIMSNMMFYNHYYIKEEKNDNREK